MPQNKQAEKRLRQSKKRAMRNKMVKTRLKTLEKRVREAVSEGQAEQAQKAFRDLTSAFDSAARKGITTKNRAARKKSRTSALLKAPKSEGSSPA